MFAAPPSQSSIALSPRSVSHSNPLLYTLTLTRSSSPCSEWLHRHSVKDNPTLTAYLQVASATKNDDIVKTTNHVITEAYKSCEQTSLSSTLPFVAVVSRSGAGKTQLAFTLSLWRPVLYMLCVRVNAFSQPVYAPFGKVTSLFMECIEDDLKTCSGDSSTEQDSHYSIPELANRPLYSATFLCEMMKRMRPYGKSGSSYSLAQQQLQIDGKIEIKNQV